MKKKIVAMLCLVTVLFTAVAVSIIPTSAAGDWIDREPPKDVNYSFAVLGDLQYATYHDTKSNLGNLEKLFSWLLDNKESRNIQYVFGLGDTVQTLTTYSDSYRNPPEWDLVSAQYARLNGQIPYGVVRGNHDDEAGYHEHICTDYYKSQMEGFFFDPSKPVTLGNSMSNSYRKLEIGNHKYLMLNLDFRVTPESLAWANDLIYDNYEYKVIISLHAYLGGDGNFYKDDIGSSNATDTVLEWLPYDGEYLWENLFARHENIMMVLCGHLGVTDPVVQTRTANNGNQVIEILVDPDSFEKDNPCGFVLMLNFTEDAQKIEVEYLAPAKGKFFKEKNQRTLTLPEGMLPTYDPTPASAGTEVTTERADSTDTTQETDTEAVTEGVSEKETDSNGLVIVLCSVLGGVVALLLICLIVWKAKKK